MMIIGVLVMTTLIGITNSAPTSYGRREPASVNLSKLLWMVDRKMPELKREMYGTSNEEGSTVVRTKRIGSLSIMNPLDVLRQMVALQWARMQATQDKQQIEANQRMFDSIGKRSAPFYGMDVVTEAMKSRLANRDRAAYDWLDEDVPYFREAQDDRTRRAEGDELRLV